jgi:hypothetical protein
VAVERLAHGLAIDLRHQFVGAALPRGHAGVVDQVELGLRARREQVEVRVLGHQPVGRVADRERGDRLVIVDASPFPLTAWGRKKNWPSLMV